MRRLHVRRIRRHADNFANVARPPPVHRGADDDDGYEDAAAAFGRKESNVAS